MTKIDKTEFSTVSSFEEADRADRIERWNLTPEERLEILETLRSYMYPDGKTAPRLQRIFESAELPQR